MESERYENRLAAAYVLGASKRTRAVESLDALRHEELLQIIETAEPEVRDQLYHFKKKDILPRVKAVLGFLKGIQPESLLDVGSGRGVFLFPFLMEFSWVPVTSVDLLPRRVAMLQSIAKGGIDTLTALQQDLCTWEQPEDSYDVLTLLEVLEHIPDVQAAVNAAVRFARRYVVVSVPSKPDNNPEHIHLLTKERLTELFAAAGCRNLHFSGVNGHLIMTAVIDE